MKIIKKITLSKKEQGKYKSFPTVVKTNDGIVAAYREGFTDPAKPHGKNGCVKLLKSKDLNRWEEFETPFCDNELDAIISGPFGDYLFLVTRSYEYKKRNDVYISKLGKNVSPTERKPLRFEKTDFTIFGHIVEYDNELIAPAYGRSDGIISPMLFASSDFGKNWQIKSLITPKSHKPVLNETSITKLDDRFCSIMRSQEPSFDLYRSFSNDLTSWSKPEKIGILGHAPMIKKLSDQKVAMVFRDLNDDLPGMGLAISEDAITWKRYNICHYTGNLYDGGYADFVEIEPDILLVVYYVCDEDNQPWIEGKIIGL